MTLPVCIKAPGKIILSGEHSVVYGCPALASTVGYYAVVESSFGATDLTLKLENFARTRTFAWAEAAELHQQIQERYQRYRNGDVAISEVTSSPEMLLVFAIVEFFAGNLPSKGIVVKVNSDIPVGAGMGSSAAIAAALLTSVSRLCGQPLAAEELYQLTHRVEHIQHGKSSGLDPAVITQGGLVLWEAGKAVQQQVTPVGRWYLLNSGKPTSTTGECVDRVRKTHGESGIWSEFAKVTQQLSAAIEQGNVGNISAAMRANQDLLTQIGVVPAPVRHYIFELESSGFSAKVTGAGAVEGSEGGLLLIFSPTGQTPLAFNGVLPTLLSFEQHQIQECTASEYGF